MQIHIYINWSISLKDFRFGWNLVLLADCFDAHIVVYSREIIEPNIMSSHWAFKLQLNWILPFNVWSYVEQQINYNCAQWLLSRKLIRISHEKAFSPDLQSIQRAESLPVPFMHTAAADVCVWHKSNSKLNESKQAHAHNNRFTCE